MSKKILIIEDEKHQRTVLKFDLSKMGYSVFEADTGEKGIKIATINKIDLIFLDIMLPDIDGFEVSRRLKENEKTKPIPIIVLSCLFQKENIEKAKELGINEYIIKPYNYENLRKTISDIL